MWAFETLKLACAKKVSVNFRFGDASWWVMIVVWDWQSFAEICRLWPPDLFSNVNCERGAKENHDSHRRGVNTGMAGDWLVVSDCDHWVSWEDGI